MEELEQAIRENIEKSFEEENSQLRLMQELSASLKELCSTLRQWEAAKKRLAGLNRLLAKPPMSIRLKKVIQIGSLRGTMVQRRWSHRSLRGDADNRQIRGDANKDKIQKIVNVAEFYFSALAIEFDSLMKKAAVADVLHVENDTDYDAVCMVKGTYGSKGRLFLAPKYDRLMREKVEAAGFKLFPRLA
ncbi:uncharacterized protein LOC131168241 [Malania oleifera]|uniref:uncharacterized protein LOC131168241 n=1 Tax=Malania oleifera TaxID=397392 RepID=UPI0025AE2D10|nr:uncharacterized protein LOC131168241 [Malania oleifera]